jgi:phosphopantothenoylcysteine decarboxylase / phosphopantothenate---cysteine ligase
MGLKDKHVLVAVTGSISAYKACDLVQRLKDEGAQVRVIMTPSAAKLVHPNTFATLTGYKVPTDAWTGTDQGAMDHIDFARWADVFLIAPCTAHTLAELAQGLTGSLVSLAYLVFQGNAYIAPAMNSVMLDAAAVRRNLELLRQKGDVILPTGEGVLACGEVGHGKLLDVAHIIAYLKTHRAFKGPLPDLSGRRVLLSLGHTREKWDDVRYLSNRSSGKTGLALARAFHLAGAQVEIVAGAAEEAFPPGLVAAFAESSADFRREMLARQKDADVVIMSAAIADFVPAQVKKGKVKDSKSLKKMDLKPFPNILKELGEKKRAGQILIGFALETVDALAYAKAKMEERNCDALVVNNPVAADSGFGKSRVQAALLRRGSKAKPTLAEWDKDELAAAVVAETAGMIRG